MKNKRECQLLIFLIFTVLLTNLIKTNTNELSYSISNLNLEQKEDDMWHPHMKKKFSNDKNYIIENHHFNKQYPLELNLLNSKKEKKLKTVDNEENFLDYRFLANNNERKVNDNTEKMNCSCKFVKDVKGSNSNSKSPSTNDSKNISNKAKERSDLLPSYKKDNINNVTGLKGYSNDDSDTINNEVNFTEINNKNRLNNRNTASTGNAKNYIISNDNYNEELNSNLQTLNNNLEQTAIQKLINNQALNNMNNLNYSNPNIIYQLQNNQLNNNNKSANLSQLLKKQSLINNNQIANNFDNYLDKSNLNYILSNKNNNLNTSYLNSLLTPSYNSNNGINSLLGLV